MSLTRLVPGDSMPTALGKINKAIDDTIIKAGSTVFVIDYGIVADGTTDDGPAIQRCFDAAPSGSLIEFPAAKSIKVSTAIYTEKLLYVRGNSSTIVCDSNITAFYFNAKDACIFINMNFIGSGRSVALKTEQVGLRFNAGTRHIVNNLRFRDMSGCGLLMVNNYGESTTLLQTGSIIDNIVLYNNKIGIGLMARSEYNVMTNILGYENDTVIQDNSGNNTLQGFSFEGNVGYGYRMFAGNNVGHGQISDGSMNHHTTAFGIHCNANGTGLTISNVSFFQTHNKFENGTKDVRFTGCRFDGTATAGAVTFDGSTTIGNIIEGCTFTVAGTDPKTKFVATNSAKFLVKDLYRVDGSMFNFGNIPATLLAAKTTNYTVTSGDVNTIVKGDATGGAITFSIPTAVGLGGQVLSFMKVDSSANAVIIDPNGTETINGSSTSISLTGQWSGFSMRSDDVNWIRITGLDLIGSATLDFPSVASLGTQTLTITVQGAVDGDEVILGVPSTAYTAGLIYCNPRVSSANTVSIDATNITLGAIDPVSATFKVTVKKR